MNSQDSNNWLTFIDLKWFFQYNHLCGCLNLKLLFALHFLYISFALSECVPQNKLSNQLYKAQLVNVSSLWQTKGLFSGFGMKAIATDLDILIFLPTQFIVIDNYLCQLGWMNHFL